MEETLTLHLITYCHSVDNMKLILGGIAVGVLLVSTALWARHHSNTVSTAPHKPVRYVTTAPITVHNFRIKPVDNVNKIKVLTENVETTEDKLNILGLIIYQEAGADYCSDNTRRKVGSVFLNRVKSSLFPDTFEEVALQKRQYGELYWTGITWPNRATSPQERHAVKRAYEIAKELLEGGSILPDNVLYQAEFPQGDGTYCYQDGFYFGYLGGIE